MGTYDENGVYRYAEDDPIAPWSDYMNLGMQSVSNAMDFLRQELDGYPAKVGVDARSPWTGGNLQQYGYPAVVEKAGIVHLTSGMLQRPAGSPALTLAAGQQHTVADLPLFETQHTSPYAEVYGVGVAFAGGSVPVPIYVAVIPGNWDTATPARVVIQPTASITFSTVGGPTDSVRLPTITWTVS